MLDIKSSYGFHTAAGPTTLLLICYSHLLASCSHLLPRHSIESLAQMVDAFRCDGSITETRVREQANTILVLTALHAHSLGHSAQG